MSDLSKTEYDCFNKAQRDSVKIIEHPEIKRLKDQIARLEKVAAESHKLYEISDEINWRNIIISMPEVIWWRYDDWRLFKKYNEKEDELRKALNELKGVGK